MWLLCRTLKQCPHITRFILNKHKFLLVFLITCCYNITLPYINMVVPIGDATNVCVGRVSRKKCVKCVCSTKIKLKSHVTNVNSLTKNSPMNFLRNASHGCGANVKAHGLSVSFALGSSILDELE